MGCILEPATPHRRLTPKKMATPTRMCRANACRAFSLSRYSGRGQGEGSRKVREVSKRHPLRAGPGPNPLPEYRPEGTEAHMRLPCSLPRAHMGFGQFFLDATRGSGAHEPA
jgi:hypothetical protein